jgi:hypothetical protein
MPVSGLAILTSALRGLFLTLRYLRTAVTAVRSILVFEKNYRLQDIQLSKSAEHVQPCSAFYLVAVRRRPSGYGGQPSSVLANRSSRARWQA